MHMPGMFGSTFSASGHFGHPQRDPQFAASPEFLRTPRYTHQNLITGLPHTESSSKKMTGELDARTMRGGLRRVGLCLLRTHQNISYVIHPCAPVPSQVPSVDSAISPPRWQPEILSSGNEHGI